jgi:zinc transporter ZupT
MNKAFLLQGFVCGFVLFVCLLERFTRAGDHDKEERAKFVMATSAFPASVF